MFFACFTIKIKEVTIIASKTGVFVPSDDLYIGKT